MVLLRLIKGGQIMQKVKKILWKLPFVKWVKTLLISFTVPFLQKKWFKLAKIGDIIWAKMPLDKEELRKIQSSHRVRPYLIVEKHTDSFACCACSSSEYKYLQDYETYCIDGSICLNKKTFVNLRDEFLVPVKNLRNGPDKLEYDHLRIIQKKFMLMHELNGRKYRKLNVYINKEVGDLVKIDHVYWVVVEVNEYEIRMLRLYEDYRTFMKDYGWGTLSCRLGLYFTDFSKTYKYNPRSKYWLSGQLTSQELQYVTQSMQTPHRKSVVFYPGLIFSDRGKMFVYLKEEDNKLIGFRKNKERWELIYRNNNAPLQLVDRMNKEELEKIILKYMKKNRGSHRVLMPVYMDLTEDEWKNSLRR